MNRLPLLALAIVLGLAPASCRSSRADQPPLRLTFMEHYDDGVCLYEAAVGDMLVAVLVRQRQGDPSCKPEVTLP